MTKKYTYQGKDYFFSRIPTTTDRNLQAWSAADEYLLQKLNDEIINPWTTMGIYHDRFGFLTSLLPSCTKHVITYLASQSAAIHKNLQDNQINHVVHHSPITSSIDVKFDLVAMKLPKSLDLLEVYFQQLAAHLTSQSKVYMGFMTRHFTPRMLALCDSFFACTKQSKAYKKSRVILLSQVKSVEANQLMTEVSYKHKNYKQCLGVFSKGKIDLATQLLLQNLALQSDEHKVMDLGTGNGIIADQLYNMDPSLHISVVDDSILAIESAKLNLSEANCVFYHAYNLEEMEPSFDLVVSNPPFHFEHEKDISIPIALFAQAHRILRPKGRLLIVANRHLNYRTHLRKQFKKVRILDENSRYQVIEAIKN